MNSYIQALESGHQKNAELKQQINNVNSKVAQLRSQASNFRANVFEAEDKSDIFRAAEAISLVESVVGVKTTSFSGKFCFGMTGV